MTQRKSRRGARVSKALPFLIIEASIKADGLRMSKQLSSGGFLGSPTYDRRTVYSIDDLYRLSREGFSLDTNAGLFLFNAFLRYPEESHDTQE